MNAIVPAAEADFVEPVEGEEAPAEAVAEEAEEC